MTKLLPVPDVGARHIAQHPLINMQKQFMLDAWSEAMEGFSLPLAHIPRGEGTNLAPCLVCDV